MTNISRRSVLKATGATSAAGITGLAGCVGNGDGDGTHEWTMAAAVSDGHPFVVAGEVFKEKLEAESDDFEIEIVPGGSYGSEIEQMETLEAGGVEMLAQSTGVSVAVYYEQFAAQRGYIFVWEDWEHYRTAFDATAEELDAYEHMENEGLKILTEPIYTGERHTFTVDTPVRTPEDAEGIAIRSPESTGWPESWSAIGFDPTAMPITEVYSALQTGTIQGGEGEAPQLIAENIYEVANYYSQTAHFYNAVWLMIRPDLFESLTEDEQQLIMDVAEETIPEAEERNEALEEEAIAQLEDEGIEFIEDVDRESMAELVEPVVQNLIEENDAVFSLEELRDMA